MKITKKITAMLLAVLMMLSVTPTAFAEASDYDINVTISQSTDALFATGEYTLTATIANASKEDAESAAEFTWESTGPLIQTSSNKTATLNNDETTYTIKQQARLTMPEAGTTFDVTAKFGASSKTVSYTSKQPITSFGFTSEATQHSYYDAASNTIYADRSDSTLPDDMTEYPEQYFNLAIKDIAPVVNDDKFYTGKISTSSTKKVLVREMLGEENTFRLYLHKDSTGLFELNIGTFSGLSSRKCNVQVCVPAEKYTLKSGAFNVDVDDSNYTDLSYMTITQGEDTVINASLTPREANDDIKYSLFYSDGTTDSSLTDLYEQKGNSCTLKNGLTPGTYLLKVKNYSKDNGKLNRAEIGEKTIEVTVNKAEYITDLKLYKVEDGVKTDKILSDITLYKDATADTKRTFQLDSAVECTPKKENTSGDYYVFQSEDPNIATVNATTGVIEAKNKGETIVWVKSFKNTNALTSVKVIVKNGTKSVSINKEDGSLEIPSGHVQNMIATRTPDPADDSLFWYSEKPETLEINSQTGVITAKEVTENTEVKISATADSGATDTKTITVVPAKRASSLQLSATTDSTSAFVENGVNKDYLIDISKRKPFVVTADIGDSNDELNWIIGYDGNAGISLTEAVSDGCITLNQINSKRYEITPLKLGSYILTCTASLVPSSPQEGDASDSIYFEILKPANSISIKDAGTDNNTSGTSYISIGGTKEITVKTATTDNDKKIDPAVYTITEGAEYISVEERASDDGEGKTYTIKGLSYGTAKIAFSSKSGSTGLKNYTFHIRNNLNDVEVKGVPESAEYTGKDIKFDSIELYYNGSKLDTSQYGVSYENNRNAGTATVVLKGKDTYNGSERRIDFKITPKTINSNTIEIGSINDVSLSDKNRKAEPSPTVRLDGTRLSKDKDYVLSYSNNDKAGWATVTVTGIGNYSGTASSHFKVIDVASQFTVVAIPAQTYTGYDIKPVPVVKYKGKQLKNKLDYELSYSGNVNMGIATVSIKGIGFYKNTVKVNFIIKPRKVSIKKPKKGKKRFTAKWKVLKGVDGYQVQYSRKKNMKKAKKKSVKDPNKASLTVKKLKKKKTYYVRVRAFKVIDGQKVYGAWSKTKKVKVK